MSEAKEPISVYTVIMMMIEQCGMLAWQKLGLQPDPMTNGLEKNLPEAKVAIDLAAHMAGLIEAQLEPDDQRQLQSLIRDLRMNYVQKSQEVNA